MQLMARGKPKTHKGAAKRFRATAKLKVKRGAGGMSHLMSTKSGQRRRRLRRGAVIASKKMADKILRMLGKK